MNLPFSVLKDSAGRYVTGALFDWELTDELADDATDDMRRMALLVELRYRGLSLSNEAQETEGAIEH